MYATDEASVRATLATAARHCRLGGGIVVVPNHVRETFEPETSHGGEDGRDGRGLRYLEWSWDPDPSDTRFEVAYAFYYARPTAPYESKAIATSKGYFGVRRG